MTYPICPKCGHAPLPADQSLLAACPACGIVLAKFAAAPVHAASAGVEQDDHPDGNFFARWLLHVPAEVAPTNWYARGAILVAAMIYTFFFFRQVDINYGDLGGHLLWLLITPWHEAGHLVFRPFGQFMHIAGGTIMQHMFPIVLGVALLRSRNPFGAALCFWLLGYSVIYTGWYMHDAGDPQGMMLSGKSSAEDDGHDFVNLFSYFGPWWYDHATRVGVFVGRVGQAMMVAGLAWGAFMLWLQKANLSDAPFAESPVDRD